MSLLNGLRQSSSHVQNINVIDGLYHSVLIIAQEVTVGNLPNFMDFFPCVQLLKSNIPYIVRHLLQGRRAPGRVRKVHYSWSISQCAILDTVAAVTAYYITM